jgi:hypothetical protein
MLLLCLIGLVMGRLLRLVTEVWVFFCLRGALVVGLVGLAFP